MTGRCACCDQPTHGNRSSVAMLFEALQNEHNFGQPRFLELLDVELCGKCGRRASKHLRRFFRRSLWWRERA